MARPPNISAKTVRELLLKVYPFVFVEELTVKQLDGYEDRNYYFKGVLWESDNLEHLREGSTACHEYVVKLFNVCNSFEFVKGVTKLLKHLKKKDFKCCYPVESRNQVDVELLSENQLIRGDPSIRAGGRVMYCVCVLTYIPGSLLCDVKITRELGYEVGSLVGSMDTLLQDFTHPVINNRIFSDPIWDTRNFLLMEGLVPSINNLKLRNIVKRIITDFRSSVLPRIPSMSHGILHYDTTSRNIVVHKTKGDEYHVAGIFDFTDSIYCPHVFELAILVAGMLSLWDCDPVVKVGSVIAGYHHTFPLSQEDLECLYTIVLARLCTVIVATSLNCDCDGMSESGYHSKIVSKAWKGMNALIKYSKEEVNKIWLDQCMHTVP